MLLLEELNTGVFDFFLYFESKFNVGKKLTSLKTVRHFESRAENLDTSLVIG